MMSEKEEANRVEINHSVNKGAHIELEGRSAKIETGQIKCQYGPKTVNDPLRIIKGIYGSKIRGIYGPKN